MFYAYSAQGWEIRPWPKLNRAGVDFLIYLGYSFKEHPILLNLVEFPVDPCISSDVNQFHRLP